MSRANASLSKQITYLSLAFGTVLTIGLVWFGWWAASRIDDRSIARETSAIHRGLKEITAKISIDQDTSAVWDDAVLNLRLNNGPWLAENLAEWMSEYFGHDRVYLLNPENHVVRSAVDGSLAGSEVYKRDQSVLEPVVLSLRQRMAIASRGLEESTEAVTGMGQEDFVSFSDGSAGFVSVRPVVPTSDAVTQAPGTEFLIVSVLIIDQSVADQIGQVHDIARLRFEKLAQTDQERMASPLINSEGRIVGFFTWLPNEPAFQLIQETALSVALGVIMVALAVALLLRRLAKTSQKLEETEAEASYLAFHDPLTGIPNRALFEDRLDQALANMRRTGCKIALHFIDLDRFKHVNDTLGHPAGDELIRQAAKRLTALVDEVDTVARLGGDEFAVVQFDAKDENNAMALSQRIVEVFAEPFELAESQANVGASVGLIVTADAAVRAEELMRQADIALYGAKDSGRGRYQMFVGELDEAVRERRALEADLRTALAEGTGLSLVYQPIFQIGSGAVAGAEALVRWDHPTQGRLSPITFISLAEERGLIEQLGLWILRRACHFASASNLPWVAVNVSPL